MSEEQLREMFDIASRAVERTFARRGMMPPIWHAVTAQGEDFMVPGFGDNKDEAVALVRALFDIRDVVRYVFVDEAWLVDRRDGAISAEERARMDAEGLSRHPDRIEIVMFSGEDAACGMAMARRRIFRPAKRKPYLGPLEWTFEIGMRRPDRIDHFEGRMIGLLPVRGARQ